ncbi:MAG: phosphate signaling complex protein PhoU [Deltaproteobacteria bacterium]|nr:phosphate signaling complex protein PhoU [Deltaproteobacteria bacterium]
MTRHLQRELERLKKRILYLGAMVEERVDMAAKAVEKRDGRLAQEIIERDHEIDEAEIEIEEECLKILALHQPVAVDLRFLSAVIKINNDLERIGDEAVNIAQRVLVIAKREKLDIRFDYLLMAEKAKGMLKRSLDAVVNLDLDSAVKVCISDDEVDGLQREAYDVIKDAVGKNPLRAGYLINMLLVSRHLERIADHATNIAEEVVYMIEGEIVRHGRLPTGSRGSLFQKSREDGDNP